METTENLNEAGEVITPSEEAENKKSKKRKGKKVDWQLYTMFIPGFILLLVFNYVPMGGLVLAFKDYTPVGGIWGSPWCINPFQNFIDALTGQGFWRLARNTVAIGGLKLVFSFPLPIFLALLFNELKNGIFKKLVQTISYLPFFISWVIISGIAYMFLATDYGYINIVLEKMGLEPVMWYTDPSKWWAILVITHIWKNTGWGTITFLAGLAAINPDLYEAAAIDGAGKWKQTLHITVPGLMPVIGITFALSAAKILQDDFDQIYALVGNNSELYSTAEVLGSWAYRVFRSGWNGYGMTTAVGLLQSICGLALMWTANIIVKKSGNPGVW